VRRLRRAPTQRADRWSRIGQTEEFIGLTHARAHDPAVVGRDDDERRRYYRITPDGTAAATAEVRRLGQLVRMARAAGFAPGKA